MLRLFSTKNYFLIRNKIIATNTISYLIIKLTVYQWTAANKIDLIRGSGTS